MFQSSLKKLIYLDLNSSGVNRSGFYVNMASKISRAYGRRHAPMKPPPPLPTVTPLHTRSSLARND